jgi:hypothetical protein
MDACNDPDATKSEESSSDAASADVNTGTTKNEEEEEESSSPVVIIVVVIAVLSVFAAGACYHRSQKLSSKVLTANAGADCAASSNEQAASRSWCCGSDNRAKPGVPVFAGKGHDQRQGIDEAKGASSKTPTNSKKRGGLGCLGLRQKAKRVIRFGKRAINHKT